MSEPDSVSPATDRPGPVTATISLSADIDHFIVSTEALTNDGEMLSTAIITWTFTATATGTRVDLVDQVVSFVGHGMIDGHRSGHEICLRQLGEFLSS